MLRQEYETALADIRRHRSALMQAAEKVLDGDVRGARVRLEAALDDLYRVEQNYCNDCGVLSDPGDDTFNDNESALTGKSSPHFYRSLEHVRISRCDPQLDVKREKGVRLYCDQHGAAWSLQLRSPLTLASGHEGKDFMIATASMSREDLLALRTAINEALADE